MRKIIRDRELVDDRWVYAGADDPLPEEVDVVVPLARFKADSEKLFARTGSLGVRIAPGEGVADIVPHLGQIALVCIDFPTMGDGRGLSYARELRERHRYGGEIRAVGEVIRDLVHGMYRCGINAFDVKEGHSIVEALNALDDFSTGYQGDVYDARPIYRRA
ncbi:MAG: DUF934 domain-containing protein [Pseudomonadota bacterium]